MDDSPFPFDLTRRRLLGAVGGTAVVSTGAVLAEPDPVSYDRRLNLATQAQGISLEVAWKEWYNGSVLERQDEPTDRSAADGPLVALPNVMPGDSGRVAIGLATTAEQGNPPPMRIEMRVREYPGARAENGITEPERKDGDTSQSVGELQEYLDLELWYDTGIVAAGQTLYGECDGAFGTGDQVLVEGTLVEVGVTDDAGAWRLLDASPGSAVGGNPCLGPNQSLCLGMDWSIAPEAGNVIQGDAVSFALEFGARQCQ